MKLRRREFVAALLAGGLQAPLATRAFAGREGSHQARLHLFDSRTGGIDGSALQQVIAGDDVVDVATLSEHDWLKLTRAQVTGSGVVTGLTGWQDFVTARELFREAGFWQARPERRIDLPTGATLFDWKLSR